MDTDILINTIKDSVAGQLKLSKQQAAEFLTYLQANKAEMSAAIATGLPDQAAVVGFRLAGWARDSAVQQIRAAEQRIFDIATAAIGVAIALV